MLFEPHRNMFTRAPHKKTISLLVTFIVLSQLSFIMATTFSFQISEYAGHNDAILIVVIPAMQAADVASSRALRLAKDIDPDGLSF